METKEILRFLEDLNANNNREWFAENKKRYEQANKSLLSLVEEAIAIVRVIDPAIGEVTPKECVFRIYKDIRFSHDKTPYKTNMGAYIARGGRKSIYGGYYVHVEPGASMLAGGIYMPDPDTLKRIRQEIYFNSPEFKGILNDKTFVKYFGALTDEGKLKKAPRDYPADFPDVELLKYRHYTMMHSVSDDVLCSAQYPALIKSVFEAMKPINDFLNRALKD
jgi:uncharacterized protein (TIGR02453 family)